MIREGNVRVGEKIVTKPSQDVTEGVGIELVGETLRYVSRGGLKLEKAMQRWGFALNDQICMDIGASTGGFTDCMLQNGASKVYAIDVGYGQLAWSLRTNDRVVNLERTNIRYITEEQVPDVIDFASIDVSFISLTLVLPVLYRFLAEGGKTICLVKPQFEAGKGKVGKKGVVREESIHREVCEKIHTFCIENGFCVRGMTFSPIKGPEGNIEYLFYLEKTDPSESVPADEIPALVALSHQTLAKG